MGNRWGNSGNSGWFFFSGLRNHCSNEIKRHSLLGRKVMTNLDSIWKSRDIALPTKVHLVKSMVFPVVMYGCESWTVEEGWAPKNWCFLTVVLEKILESPLDCKEIQPVLSEGDQPWDFLETMMLCNHLILCRLLLLLPSVFPASGSFPMSWLFTSGGWSIGASALASVLPMNIQGFQWIFRD